jgi:triosephosphate isomerase
MARKPIFGGNWKMNHTLEETEAFLQDFINRSFPEGSDVILFPPFTSLHLMSKYLKGTSVAFGAQNFYHEPKGAFTGEVSLSMLKAMGCEYVLVGHSERREIFGEPDELIRAKTKAALDAGVIPMVCVGETLDERNQGRTSDKIRTQVRSAVEGLSNAEAEKLLFAYEPIWAIGTGVNASEQDASDGIAVVREALRESFGTIADSIRIVYGGSVKPDNIAKYMSLAQVDGGLVGGASLKSADFHTLIESGTQANRG